MKNLTPGFTLLCVGGDDFYKFFLGPGMVYTTGIIKDLDRAETLEELQDNNSHCRLREARPTTHRSPPRHRVRMGNPRSVRSQELQV